MNADNGVLDNDTDAENDGLTAVLVTAPSSGTVTLNPTARSTTPRRRFHRQRHVHVPGRRRHRAEQPATVTITVERRQRPADGAADSYTTAEDTPLTVGGHGVLGNDTDPDGDALTAERVRNVANGTLQLNANGVVHLHAGRELQRHDELHLSRARRRRRRAPPVTVTITVTAVNDAPFVTNSPPTTATEGVTYRYTLAASDPDGNALTIAAPTLPSWLASRRRQRSPARRTTADAGSHDVTMTVSRRQRPRRRAEVPDRGRGVDNAPAIAAIPDQTATEASPFDLDLAAFVTDADTAAERAAHTPRRRRLPRGLALSRPAGCPARPRSARASAAHTVAFTVADATTKVPGQMGSWCWPRAAWTSPPRMSVAPNPVTLDAPATWTVTIANRAPQVESQAHRSKRCSSAKCRSVSMHRQRRAAP